MVEWKENGRGRIDDKGNDARRVYRGSWRREKPRSAGTVLRSRTRAEKAEVTRKFAAHVVPLLARGAVQPVIDSVYELGDVRAAHERMESNASFGKIVLTM
ncbi:MAG: zinc-binding dehydrogenase [Pyrinomonadaceae bacterium]